MGILPVFYGKNLNQWVEYCTKTIYICFVGVTPWSQPHTITLQCRVILSSISELFLNNGGSAIGYTLWKKQLAYPIHCIIYILKADVHVYAFRNFFSHKCCVMHSERGRKPVKWHSKFPSTSIYWKRKAFKNNNELIILIMKFHTEDMISFF